MLPPASLPIVLLVDDNHDDVFMLQRTLRKAEVPCVVHPVSDGQAAINYLSGKYADFGLRSLPAVIVTDLHLPTVSGFDLIRWTRQQPACKALPIIVLSGSADPGDRRRAAELGASCFLEKSAEHGRLIEKLIDALDGQLGPSAPRGKTRKPRAPL